MRGAFTRKSTLSFGTDSSTLTYGNSYDPSYFEDSSLTHGLGTILESEDETTSERKQRKFEVSTNRKRLLDDPLDKISLKRRTKPTTESKVNFQLLGLQSAAGGKLYFRVYKDIDIGLDF